MSLRCVFSDVGGGRVHGCGVPSVGLVCVGVTHTVGRTSGSGDVVRGEWGGEWVER